LGAGEPNTGNFFFSSRRRHTRWPRDWSSDVCSSGLKELEELAVVTVSARLRNQIHYRTERAAVFRAVARIHDFDFGNAVHAGARDRKSVVAKRRQGGIRVDARRVRTVEESVQPRKARLRAVNARLAEGSACDRTRRQRDQPHDVAPVEGKVLYLFGADRVLDGGAAGLDRRHRAGYCDLLVAAT